MKRAKKKLEKTKKFISDLEYHVTQNEELRTKYKTLASVTQDIGGQLEEAKQGAKLEGDKVLAITKAYGTLVDQTKDQFDAGWILSFKQYGP